MIVSALKMSKDMAEAENNGSGSDQAISDSKNGEEGLRAGKWTPEEDMILWDHVMAHGANQWNTLRYKVAGLRRSGPSCRHRWNNYLKPGLKQGVFSMEEKKKIMELQKSHGNNWGVISDMVCMHTNSVIFIV